ncbi:Vitamin D3 hydroxylase-associated protein [Orchesella cincta]|uniref:Vitamin D3 hydroxylase-associated protein n=1 Tax=Orchesella cincta TaxID=48709 RepID=A0A1D2M1X0_ORCCI|nr:Vitamin D3 hydroxylase-associated protein [Orchesella cincta]
MYGVTGRFPPRRFPPKVLLPQGPFSPFLGGMVFWGTFHGGKGPWGPLHGLPIAVKEDHDVEGMDTTMGFAKYSTKPAKENGNSGQNFVETGAVPVSNEKMAPGGSSQAPLLLWLEMELDSDWKLTEKGATQCVPEVDAQRGVPGFIAKNAEALSLVWKAILGNNIQNEFDPMTVPIPWNETLFTSTSKPHNRVFYFPRLLPSVSRHRFSYIRKMFDGEPVSPCLTGLVESFRNPEQMWKKDEKHTKRETISSAARRLVDEKPESAERNIIMENWRYHSKGRLFHQLLEDLR